MQTIKRCVQCHAVFDETHNQCPRCEGNLVPIPPDTRVIDGRYVVDTVLGQGSMGVVYRADDLGLQRKVAIKVISTEMARQSDLVSRFRREATALAAVRNEHVVQVYTFGPYRNTYFFAMEYIDGRNLDEVLARYANVGALVAPPLAVALLRQLASGLAAVHAAKIVHRDIKPGNVVIENLTGRPVLIDFGLAKETSSQIMRNSMSAGTPEYVAPEQVLGDAGTGITYKTDQYAFGCTAYEILTGRTPYEGASAFEVIRQHIESPPPLISAVRPELARFDSIIARSMAKNPDHRYDSLQELKHELENVSKDWFLADTRALTQDPTPVRQKRVGTRVLSIDADDAFARLAARAAQLAFFRSPVSVSTAFSAQDAVQNAAKNPPDLVVIGHNPPHVDAVSLLQQFRNSQFGNNVSVLAAVPPTREGTLSNEARELMNLGVTNVLTKPANLHILAESIQRIAQSNGWLTANPHHSEDD